MKRNEQSQKIFDKFLISMYGEFESKIENNGEKFFMVYDRNSSNIFKIKSRTGNAYVREDVIDNVRRLLDINMFDEDYFFCSFFKKYFGINVNIIYMM
jgi:hypothetical protein